MSVLLDAAERRTLLRLARAAIEERLLPRASLREDLARAELTERLEADGASFVTLETVAGTTGGKPKLRGCIGTLHAREPLFRDVIGNAVKSAFSDPRFPELGRDELDGVRVGVSVLGPMTAIERPAEIVIGRDGVQLEGAGHSAVFLPQVAVEQGWDTTALLEELSLKAGLPRGAWHESSLSTFRTESFRED
jgi:AmmeMemoRadiSam system protein A